MNNLTSKAGSDQRKFKRNAVSLRSVVQIREDKSYKELTNITTVSKNGAEFNLSRECKVGELVLMVIPMPIEFRLYDLDEKVYATAAIVQRCFEKKVRRKKVFHFAVAFIGKHVPDSYLANPHQTYRICGTNDDATWRVIEAKTPHVARRHMRFWQKIEISITLLGRDRRLAAKERTVTRDVSEGGMSVVSTIEATIGDRLKIACNTYDFYTIGVVRNCNKSKDDKNILHVEFLEARFATERLEKLVFQLFDEDA